MENENEKIVKERKGSSTVLIIIIVVLVLIIIGLIGFICYDRGLQSSTNKNDIKETNSKANKKDRKDTEKKETVKKLDLSKSLNTSNVSYKNASDTIGDYGLSMNINSDKKSITLSIDWNKFGPLSTASAWSPAIETYQITGFTKEIASTFVGELGQDAMGLTLFYLMTDGTVEYTPMFNLVNFGQANTHYEMNYSYNYSADGRVVGDPYFVTKGTVSAVTSVIKLYNVDAYSDTGARTVIGAKADGSFYDLGTIIK